MRERYAKKMQNVKTRRVERRYLDIFPVTFTLIARDNLSQQYDNDYDDEREKSRRAPSRVYV